MMRPIAQAPDWVLKYLDKTVPWIPHGADPHRKTLCCHGFICLSRDAVLIFCNKRNHVSPDKYKGKTRVNTGFIIKRFPRPGRTPIIRYRMKISRAMKLQRPLIEAFHSYSDLSFITGHRLFAWRERERDQWRIAPLSDDEWMLATAVMYFLEKWP